MALIVGAGLMLAAGGCEGRAQMQAILERIGGQTEGKILPDREDYYGSFAFDKDHAWVVGSYGTVLFLSDSGGKAKLLKAPVRYSLFCVSASSPQNVLIGGERGLMLKSNDGGEHWNEVKLPKINQNIFAMSRGKDPHQIWAIGPMSTIIHSSDDGETWEDIGLKKDLILNGVTFIDDREGWITGEFGTIMHTGDGGKTWQDRKNVKGLPKYVEDVSDEEALRRGVPTLEEADLYLFQSVFKGPNEGYIVGAGGFVLGTADAGQNWQAVHAATRNTLFTYASPAGGAPISTGVLGTMTRETKNGWTLDTTITGKIFTWLRSVAFAPDNSLGIVTGGKGTILISHDAGVTWEQMSPDVLAAAAR